MDAYKGSPDYVRAGFLADLLGPWCNVEGSELGTHLTALHHAAETSLSIEEHKRAAILTDAEYDLYRWVVHSGQ
jgi:hypothetical protein